MRLVVISLAVFILLSGCGLISILILVDEEIPATTASDLYIHSVDVTGDADWDDNKDKIEFVNYVTFDLYLSNSSTTSDVTFNGYIDNFAHTICADMACAEGKVRVLRNIVVPPGGRHITAGQSFAFIENMETMKTLAEKGQFHFYGVSTDGVFAIDSGRVIVAIVVAQ